MSLHGNAALRKKQRVTRAYIYVMLTVYPLVTGLRGYLDLTHTKLVFFVAVTALWLLALLIISLTASGFRPARLTHTHRLLIIYFAVCCASALASPYRDTVLSGAGRFDGLLATALYLCIFLGASRYAKPEHGYVYALAVSVTLSCLVALLQFSGQNSLRLFPADYNYYDMGIKFSGEFYGTAGNAGLSSAFLTLALPILCAACVYARRRWLFLLPAIALGAFCLFFCTVAAGKLALIVFLLVATPVMVTDMRRLCRWAVSVGALGLGGLLAAGFAALRLGDAAPRYVLFGAVFVILVPPGAYFLRKKQVSKRVLRLALTSISVIIAVSATVYVYTYTGTAGTLFELSRVLHGDVRDAFGSSRVLIWRKALGLVAERPVLGGGPGSFSRRLDISFSRLVEQTGQTLTSRVDNAHNVYLGILTDTGVFALLFYLAAMAKTLAAALRREKTAPLTTALACGLLGYWAQDFFGLGLFITAPIMWLVWGLAAGSRRYPPGS